MNVKDFDFLSLQLISFLLFMCATTKALISPSQFLVSRSSTQRFVKMEVKSFYDLQEKDAKGDTVSFQKFRNKVVYGVNVASKCGYTKPGYELLEQIAKIEGVEVLLFPCNQFGGQEPGTDYEIEQFCALKNVQGANVFTKGDVNGPQTRDTYKFIKNELKMGDITWNFAGK